MAERKPIQIQKVGRKVMVIALTLSALTAITIALLFYENNKSNEIHHHHNECIEAANTLMDASDYLTSEVRMYVMTERRIYAENYLREVYVDRRRDKALEVLGQDERHRESLEALVSAFEESTQLSQTELYAMNLMASADNMDHVPTAISEQYLSAEDLALPSAQKRALAQELVLGEAYQTSKDAIVADVSACTLTLLNELQSEENDIETKRTVLIVCLSVIALLFVLLLYHVVYAVMTLVVYPIRKHADRIEQDEALEITGAQELQQMALAYNKMFELNQSKTRMLEHEAHTDPLTGLLNRGVYDRILAEQRDDIVLIIVDVDNFKEINDGHGHTVGDEVLKWVGTTIASQFRMSDYTCRIGGDEFSVIMTHAQGVGHAIVEHKLMLVAAELRRGTQELPPTSISVGVAFRPEVDGNKSMYRLADEALYHAKEHGRNRLCFYENGQFSECVCKS